MTGSGHPERAERVDAFVAGLRAAAEPSEQADSVAVVFRRPEFDGGRSEVDEALAAVHEPSYIDLVRRVCASLGDGELAQLPTGDTIVCRSSYARALLAARSAVQAASAATPDGPAFSAMRPPGHHATPDRGMGFCIFNNVATAAAWARDNVGAVLIVDFDYHHGNGTQAWVERALGGPGAPVGFVSTHAYPAYPGTGAFNESQIVESGFVVDVPLPLSIQTDDFIAVWAALLPPLAKRLAPKMILVSAGFDFLSGDPIAGLPVALRAVEALCDVLKTVSAQTAAPLALVLEGGYSLENMRASGRAVADSFSHGRTATEPNRRMPTDARLQAMVSQVLGSL